MRLTSVSSLVGRFVRRNATTTRVPQRIIPIHSTRTHPHHFSSKLPTAPLSGSTSEDVPIQKSHLTPRTVVSTLLACPGCGALAQTIEPGEAGHYSISRKAVRSYVESQIQGSAPVRSEDDIVAQALQGVRKEILEANGLQGAAELAMHRTKPEMPFCDRCHDLLHHRKGVPIAHPSIDSIQDTIADSPWKHNHIYHVIDAADFPMSLIPGIHKELAASLQRSRNRRAKHAAYRHGKKTEISFIITRSDLLAPRKEQVDRLMVYLISVLRQALGRFAEDVRLGNVRCVSAKRAWWTRELKSDIWERGGGGWMVGKVNVGKSKLFEVVFPKGRAEDVSIQGIRSDAISIGRQRESGGHTTEDRSQRLEASELLNGDENSLLPPARVETPFPVMPTISSLPGTTAAPIRIPFGNGKGELVDLPGLARSNIEQHVRPEFRDELVMKARIVPEQYTLLGGRSLLLSDIVRITPVDPNVTILAYAFVPLAPHLTSTAKAIDIQAGVCSENTGLSIMLNPEARTLIRSAGRFQLRWDVTKERAGPLTTKSGVGMKTHNLPFKVVSADILIEGVGWVELVAQVRRRRLAEDNPFEVDNGSSEEFPEVEVFSPEGKFIGIRQPMGGWLLNALMTKPGQKRKSGKKRPRQSMASVKKQRQAMA